MSSKHSPLDTLGRFALHTVAGSLIVVIVAGAAHAVHLFLNWLRPTADPVMIYVLTGLKYGILGADVIVAIATVWNSTVKAIKELREAS